MEQGNAADSKAVIQKLKSRMLEYSPEASTEVVHILQILLVASVSRQNLSMSCWQDTGIQASNTILYMLH